MRLAKRRYVVVCEGRLTRGQPRGGQMLARNGPTTPGEQRAICRLCGAVMLAGGLDVVGALFENV